MKKTLVSAALALALIAGSPLQAFAAGPWTLGVPVDITSLLAHGYASKSLSLLVKCSVLGTSNSEIGYGVAEDVPVNASGFTTVVVKAKSNAPDTIAYRYSCTASVGNGSVNLATTGGPATGGYTGSVMQTPPIVLAIVPKKSIDGITLQPPRSTGPVSAPPRIGSLPGVQPAWSASTLEYGPLTEITTCPANITYKILVKSAASSSLFSYEFRSSTTAADSGVSHGIQAAATHGGVTELSYSEVATGKGTHYVWFQIVAPELVTLAKFPYVVNCP